VNARLLKGRRQGDKPLLVIRTPCTAEGEAMARAFAGPAGLDPCALGEPPAPGLSIWLSVMKRIPVLHRNAGPGETIDLGPFDSLETPLIIIAGQHGQVASVRTGTEWRAQAPTEAERSKLWSGWGLDDAQAGAAALRYRHGSGRIAEVGREVATSGSRSLEGVVTATMGGGGKIDALARRSSSTVKREDIVLPLSLGQALDRLRDRILLRNRLQDGLGPTISSSYRPGVRALFSGESGTGKTLAAQWLAREAGLPCYRVDLAALTSKWIGETEKNLSSLFDAAEHSDVLLFFDEADALFGARTEVSDAHDRHANAQTNFLLQRIEEFDGVALLATNGRSRFDPAFVRRLDAVLEFPLPDAPARRKLWDCHLGKDHHVSARRLDRLAAEIDLAGGHVRNVVLAASARARAEGRSIESSDLDAAIVEEYAKLGRSAPSLPGG
jgi:AAA+ superfamily predicted ATPase